MPLTDAQKNRLATATANANRHLSNAQYHYGQAQARLYEAAELSYSLKGLNETATRNKLNEVSSKVCTAKNASGIRLHAPR